MTYRLQIIRSAAQRCYWQNYRYRDGKKGTMLKFMYDFLPDDEISDSPFDEDHTESDKWLGCFLEGYRNRKTGLNLYTIPRKPRLDSLTHHIDEAGMLTPVDLMDHAGDAEQAAAVAKHLRCDRFANQVLLSGALRGHFHATFISEVAIEHRLLVIHFVAGDKYFRVREITVTYHPHIDEKPEMTLAQASTIDWDGYSVRDGFAATGTDHGAVFLLRSYGLGYIISDYNWNNKGHRILSFHAEPEDGSQKGSTFHLCQKPFDINFSLEIMRSVSERMNMGQAAE